MCPQQINHSHSDGMSDPLFTSLRTIEKTFNADGSATSHVVKRTLADIATATNLRPEDAAFALNVDCLRGRPGEVYCHFDFA
jgi:hypothetical protein